MSSSILRASAVSVSRSATWDDAWTPNVVSVRSPRRPTLAPRIASTVDPTTFHDASAPYSSVSTPVSKRAVEKPASRVRHHAATSPDALIFDKAEKAESVSNLKEKLAEVEARIRDYDKVLADSPKEQARAAATTEKEELQHRAERLSALIARKEAKISKD